VITDTTGGSTPGGNAAATVAAEDAAAGRGAVSLIEKGAAAGSALGPFGILLGGFVGLFVDAVWGDKTDWPGLPWESWGMPYWPDSTYIQVDDDGVERLHVAIVTGNPDAPNTLAQAWPTEVKVETALLRQMYPGPGAFEACLASGMFCWRPKEVPTPFSDLLNRPDVAPWLLNYENQFLQGFFYSDADDLQRQESGGSAYQNECDWLHFGSSDDMTDTTGQAIRVSLNIMRRLFAGVAYYGVDRMRQEIHARFDGKEEYYRADLFNWVDNQLVALMRSGVTFQMSMAGFTVPSEYYRMNCYCGFPGAWMFTTAAPTVTTLSAAPDFSDTGVRTSALRPTSTVARTGTLTARAMPTLPKAPAAAPAPSAGRSSLKIVQWFPTFEPNVAGWSGGVEDRNAKVWGQIEVIPLQLFLDTGLFVDEADVVAELSAGELAWGPNWSDRARQAWARIVPATAAPWVDLRRRRLIKPTGLET
jgi:hypothetical protein